LNDDARSDIPPFMHMSHDPASQSADPISFDQFLAVDIRVGRIVEASAFPEARKPAFKLSIDFGPAIGIKKSSAQITEHYALEALPGRLVAAVVNFPPRQIGKFMSEVLTLGFPDENGAVVLFAPDQAVPLGGRLF
jgi:tRNA-binding protein